MVSIRKDSISFQSLSLNQTQQTKKIEQPTTLSINQPLLSFSKSDNDPMKALEDLGTNRLAQLQMKYEQEIASSTNSTLKALGYNYKVAPTQVHSVANGFNNVVAPGMQLAAEGAVKANIQNPNGPFAELFA